MSQIEQEFWQFLSKNPEIESSYASGLINRRSLARYLIKLGLAQGNQLEAVIAMLRRYQFQKIAQPQKNLFREMKINLKDKVMILNFEKRKELVQKLQQLIANVHYDRGDILKIVVGSSSIKVFVDEEQEKKVKEVLEPFKIKNKIDHLSEVSILFPEEAIKDKGILSVITKELAVNGIVISELLTASPELLIYLKEEYVLKAYEILKRLQKSN